MVMMHGFAAGDDDADRAAQPRRHGRDLRDLTSTGCTDERAQDFIAQGMLLNVMLSMRAPEHLDEDDDLAALTRCAFGDALPFVTP